MQKNRHLTPEFKEEFRRAIGIWEGPLREGVGPSHVLDQIARHVEGLLELPKSDLEGFYQKGE
jgi:hypothetical protein